MTTKKPEIIHIKKFDGGRSTPDEVHRKLSYGNRKCTGCQSTKPAVRIRVLMTAADLTKLNPDMAAHIMAANPPSFTLPTVATTYGPACVISDNVFCDICKTQAEKDAAHPPRGFENKILVEIDRMGLANSHRPVVQSKGV